MRSRHGASTVAALVAGVGTTATLVVYLAVIHSQDHSGQLTSSRVIFVAVSLACVAALALLGPFVREPSVQAAMLNVSALMLLVFTVLGAFSIGILLLVPALCAVFAAGCASARLRLVDAWTIALTAAILVAVATAVGVNSTS